MVTSRFLPTVHVQEECNAQLPGRLRLASRRRMRRFGWCGGFRNWPGGLRGEGFALNLVWCRERAVEEVECVV